MLNAFNMIQIYTERNFQTDFSYKKIYTDKNKKCGSSHWHSYVSLVRRERIKKCSNSGILNKVWKEMETTESGHNKYQHNDTTYYFNPFKI